MSIHAVVLGGAGYVEIDRFNRESAFASIEEAARNLAGRVCFFLVVNGEREEVPARVGLFAANSCNQNLRLGHVDQNGTVGLTSDCPGLDGDYVFPILERFLY